MAVFFMRHVLLLRKPVAGCGGIAALASELGFGEHKLYKFSLVL